MSAYACEPGRGSEPEVGWRWALQMARYHEVTVLTRANNKPVIEAELARMGEGEPRPEFAYFDLPDCLQRIKKRFSLHRPYYAWWQRMARQFVGELLKVRSFDIVHHVTFATYRSTPAVCGLGLPSIWGPVGGVESIPLGLLPWKHPGTLMVELLRNFDNALQTAFLGLTRMRALQSRIVLASTLQMKAAFHDLGIPARLMPTVGLDLGEMPRLGPAPAPSSGPLRLLYVGNLLALKGVDLALEALSQSGLDATLTLIGDGPFQRNLERLARRLGLADRVNFRGRLPRREVLASYPDFDAFVFPSLHDTGGFAVLEAMASSLPVLCLAVGGPEIAVRAGCGVCVPLGSRSKVVAELASVLRHFDQDRKGLAEMGRQARFSIEAHYDWDRKGAAMNEIYNELRRMTPPCVTTRSSESSSHHETDIDQSCYRHTDFAHACGNCGVF